MLQFCSPTGRMESVTCSNGKGYTLDSLYICRGVEGEPAAPEKRGQFLDLICPWMPPNSRKGKLMYKFLSIGEAATYLGITEKALRRRIEKGNGPPVMHSGRRVEISEDVLLDWIKRKESTSTPTEGIDMSELEKSLDQARDIEEGFISKEQREVNEVKARYVDLIKQGRETIARISKMRAKYGA